mmetsp:Transcript_30409/g.90742  ORF Transcript_30409/g.90742 Transcript_30409/m.90742 type:complete len:551 (-) Transcript_30409:430-2082(-)
MMIRNALPPVRRRMNLELLLLLKHLDGPARLERRKIPEFVARGTSPVLHLGPPHIQDPLLHLIADVTVAILEDDVIPVLGPASIERSLRADRSAVFDPGIAPFVGDIDVAAADLVGPPRGRLGFALPHVSLPPIETELEGVGDLGGHPGRFGRGKMGRLTTDGGLEGDGRPGAGSGAGSGGGGGRRPSSHIQRVLGIEVAIIHSSHRHARASLDGIVLPLAAAAIHAFEPVVTILVAIARSLTPAAFGVMIVAAFSIAPIVPDHELCIVEGRTCGRGRGRVEGGFVRRKRRGAQSGRGGGMERRTDGRNFGGARRGIFPYAPHTLGHDAVPIPLRSSAVPQTARHGIVVLVALVAFEPEEAFVVVVAFLARAARFAAGTVGLFVDGAPDGDAGRVGGRGCIPDGRFVGRLERGFVGGRGGCDGGFAGRRESRLDGILTGTEGRRRGIGGGGFGGGHDGFGRGERGGRIGGVVLLLRDKDEGIALLEGFGRRPGGRSALGRIGDAPVGRRDDRGPGTGGVDGGRDEAGQGDEAQEGPRRRCRCRGGRRRRR